MVLLSTQTIKGNSAAVPTIEWSNLSLTYPISARSVGVEVYNNTLYAFGGKPNSLSAPYLFYIDIDDLVNYNENDIDSAKWSNYSWIDDNSTGTLYSINYFSVTGSSLIGNLIYLAGIEVFPVMPVFDVETNSQVSMDSYNFSFPDVTDAACATNNGTHLFRIGGRYSDDQNSSHSLRIYNPTTDSWSLGAEMNEGRAFFSCNFDEVSNVIWVFSGRDWQSQGIKASSIEYYSFEKNQWFVLDSSLTFTRGTHTSIMFSIDSDALNYYNYGFVFGGGTTTYLTELLNISISNLNDSVVLNYSEYSAVSDLPQQVELINARYLPSKYDILNVSYDIYDIDPNYWYETTLVRKTMVFVAGEHKSTYLNSISKGVITVNETKLLPVPPTMVPTMIPTMQPTICMCIICVLTVCVVTRLAVLLHFKF